LPGPPNCKGTTCLSGNCPRPYNISFVMAEDVVVGAFYAVRVLGNEEYRNGEILAWKSQICKDDFVNADHTSKTLQWFTVHHYNDPHHKW